jgi:hypothetical protein
MSTGKIYLNSYSCLYEKAFLIDFADKKRGLVIRGPFLLILLLEVLLLT